MDIQATLSIPKSPTKQPKISSAKSLLAILIGMVMWAILVLIATL